MSAEEEEATLREEEEEEEATVGEGEQSAKKKKSKKKKKKKAGADGDAEPMDDGAAAAEGATAAADADADGGGDDDGEAGGDSASKKKREKRKAAAARKKAAAAEAGGGGGGGGGASVGGDAEWSTEMRGIKQWRVFPKPEPKGRPQTWPPTVPVLAQFPSGEVPLGEVCEYKDHNTYRTTSAEMRELERLQSTSYQEVRLAAECHRQVRKHMQQVIKPGRLMTEICEELEDLNRSLVEENGLKARAAVPAIPRA